MALVPHVVVHWGHHVEAALRPLWGKGHVRGKCLSDLRPVEAQEANTTRLLTGIGLKFVSKRAANRSEKFE